MGTDKHETSSGGFKRVRETATNGNGAHWSEANADMVLACIEALSKKGGALRFGCTRDGGALSVGVYAGSDYFTEYIRPSEDVGEYLEKLLVNCQEYMPTGESFRKKK